MNEKISTRDAYGNALCEFGVNEDIVAVEADLGSCTMSCTFGEKYPDRYFNVGIAEANMINIDAGFATTGKIAFCHSFAMFTAGRGYDQIRNSIAYPALNVKIIGSHAGLTVGEDGATHQCIEDLSLMRTIPGMVVLSPCDGNETREAVMAMLAYNGPVYMRTGRCDFYMVTNSIDTYKFEIGKGAELRKGSDAAIIATGLMVQEALKAAATLEAEGVDVRVIDMHTIKPLDQDIVIRAAKETGAIVTAEEHSIIGGLGSAVSEVLTSTCYAPLERVGVEDRFGRSAEAMELLDKYGLSCENIVVKVMKVMRRKEIS